MPTAKELLRELIGDNLMANKNEILRLLLEAMKLAERASDSPNGEQKKHLVLDALCLIFPNDREWLSNQIEFFISIGKASLGIVNNVKRGCCSKN